MEAHMHAHSRISREESHILATDGANVANVEYKWNYDSQQLLAAAAVAAAAAGQRRMQYDFLVGASFT